MHFCSQENCSRWVFNTFLTIVNEAERNNLTENNNKNNLISNFSPLFIENSQQDWTYLHPKLQYLNMTSRRTAGAYLEITFQTAVLVHHCEALRRTACRSFYPCNHSWICFMGFFWFWATVQHVFMLKVSEGSVQQKLWHVEGGKAPR